VTITSSSHQQQPPCLNLLSLSAQITSQQGQLLQPNSCSQAHLGRRHSCKYWAGPWQCSCRHPPCYKRGHSWRHRSWWEHCRTLAGHRSDRWPPRSSPRCSC